jgi:hypothetical protein
MALNMLKSGGRAVLFGFGAVVAVIVLVGIVLPRLFDFPTPFTKEQIDRTPPVVLTEINDLAEFRAAEAQFEVVVDQEDDFAFVPDFIAGERVQYVAVGSVDAVVDFSALDAESVIHDEETGRVIVILPEPTIGDPVVDYDNSGVMNRDRGVLDRLGGVFSDNPTGEEKLIVAATDKMVAAVPASDLLQRAEDNTEKMLTTLLAGVGVEEVDVVFERSSVT